jgi:hydrogenase small subunit
MQGASNSRSLLTLCFNDIPDVWLIGIGAPCVGCTEKDIAFRVPMFQTVEIHAATPSDSILSINTPVGSIGNAAAATAGAAVTAAVIASRRLPDGKGMHVIEKLQGTAKPKDKNIDPEGR